MPSPLLERNVKKLIKLARPQSHNTIKRCIRKMSKDGINSIVECNMNVLKKNVKLKSCQFKKLKKYKKEMLELYKLGDTDTRFSKTPSSKLLSAKRKVISQRGGFLTALLGPILSTILIPLVKKIFL
jgi:hypothetical protein